MVTEEEVGTSEMHEMNIRQTPVESDAGEASSVPIDQSSASIDLQQLPPQLEGVVSIPRFFSQQCIPILTINRIASINV